jgi:hypothetical protein
MRSWSDCHKMLGRLRCLLVKPAADGVDGLCKYAEQPWNVACMQMQAVADYISYANSPDSPTGLTQHHTHRHLLS